MSGPGGHKPPVRRRTPPSAGLPLRDRAQHALTDPARALPEPHDPRHVAARVDLEHLRAARHGHAVVRQPAQDPVQRRGQLRLADRRDDLPRTRCAIDADVRSTPSTGANVIPRRGAAGAATSWIATPYPARCMTTASADPTSPLPRTSTVCSCAALSHGEPAAPVTPWPAAAACRGEPAAASAVRSAGTSSSRRAASSSPAAVPPARSSRRSGSRPPGRRPSA